MYLSKKVMVHAVVQASFSCLSIGPTSESNKKKTHKYMCISLSPYVLLVFKVLGNLSLYIIASKMNTTMCDRLSQRKQNHRSTFHYVVMNTQ